MPVCQERGTAFLLNDHAPLVADAGADGSHVQCPVKGVRDRLPEGAILGAGCGLSRHEAMLAGEDGADYVSFGPWGEDAAALLAWWQELMELPCVAAGGLTIENAARAADAGADFVALRGAVWKHPAGPAAAVAALARSLAASEVADR